MYYLMISKQDIDESPDTLHPDIVRSLRHEAYVKDINGDVAITALDEVETLSEGHPLGDDGAWWDCGTFWLFGFNPQKTPNPFSYRIEPNKTQKRWARILNALLIEVKPIEPPYPYGGAL